MPDSPIIPARFQSELDQHLVFNFAGTPSWPLVLGVFGRPGDGKSFPVRTHLERRGVLVISINAADLESDRAGQPGKLVLVQLPRRRASNERGCSPAALIVDDFDTTAGEWEQSTSTVNHQQVLAQLMHLADSPTQAADKQLRRVPVFVTGNDLSKIYAPLRRPGRMRPFLLVAYRDGAPGSRGAHHGAHDSTEQEQPSSLPSSQSANRLLLQSTRLNPRNRRTI